jgi:HNH endonuclease
MANRPIGHLDTQFDVLVDDEDMDILVKSWFVSFKQKGKDYCSVRRKLRKSELVEGKKKSVKLHNEVWEKHFGPVPEGHEIDHVNYNTCDNRKENLRLLTKKENNERARKKKEKQNGESMVEAA